MSLCVWCHSVVFPWQRQGWYVMLTGYVIRWHAGHHKEWA